jgi:hypothetical protein
MILSSEELQILDYLKGYQGKFVTIMEISRRAAGRRKYEESPDWAKGLMTRLIDVELVEVNERGRYRAKPDESAVAQEAKANTGSMKRGRVVDENYFPPPPPAEDENYFPSPDPVVGEDYFPTAGEPQSKLG